MCRRTPRPVSWLPRAQWATSPPRRSRTPLLCWPRATTSTWTACRVRQGTPAWLAGRGAARAALRVRSALTSAWAAGARPRPVRARVAAGLTRALLAWQRLFRTRLRRRACRAPSRRCTLRPACRFPGTLWLATTTGWATCKARQGCAHGAGAPWLTRLRRRPHSRGCAERECCHRRALGDAVYLLHLHAAAG